MLLTENRSCKRPRPDFVRQGSRPHALSRVPSCPFVTAKPEAERSSDCAAWFAAHDGDGDGRLTPDEFRGLLLSLGSEAEKLHPKYVEHVLAQTARDADGCVSLSEVHGSLLAMDKALRAPRRASRWTGADLRASRVAGRSAVTLPEVATQSHSIGQGERRHTFVLPTRYTSVGAVGEGAYGVIATAVDTAAPGGRRSVAIKRVRPAEDALQLRSCAPFAKKGARSTASAPLSRYSAPAVGLRELAVLRHTAAHPHPNLLSLQRVLPPCGGAASTWRRGLLCGGTRRPGAPRNLGAAPRVGASSTSSPSCTTPTCARPRRRRYRLQALPR